MPETPAGECACRRTCHQNTCWNRRKWTAQMAVPLLSPGFTSFLAPLRCFLALLVYRIFRRCNLHFRAFFSLLLNRQMYISNYTHKPSACVAHHWQLQHQNGWSSGAALQTAHGKYIGPWAVERVESVAQSGVQVPAKAPKLWLNCHFESQSWP